MLKVIRDRLFGIKTVAGIEVNFLSDTNTFNYVILETVKDSIRIADQGKTITDPVELFKNLPKDIPISLSITGKGILYKKIEGPVSNDYAKVIQAVIPNANPKDFYIQFDPANSIKHVHVARSNVVDSLIRTFKEAGYFVTSINLGPVAITDLVPLIHTLSDISEVSIAGYTFSYNNRIWENFKAGVYDKSTPSELINIGDDHLDQENVLKYASAFHVLTGSFIPSNMDSVVQARDEYSQKQIFTKAGWAVLISFLVVLLSNFFFFNYYTKQYSLLSATQQSNQSLLNTLNDLQVKLSEKEKFINKSGWYEPSRNSYYSDRIAMTVPPSVLLTELSLNPVDVRKLKEQKLIEFSPGTTKISGTCSRSLELNGWIKKLTELEFVGKVDVKNYIHDEFENIGKFEIEIQLK